MDLEPQCSYNVHGFKMDLMTEALTYVTTFKGSASPLPANKLPFMDINSHSSCHTHLREIVSFYFEPIFKIKKLAPGGGNESCGLRVLH